MTSTISTAAATAAKKDFISASILESARSYEADCFQLAEQLKQHWAYDIDDRRPGPAILYDGLVKPTDLDLACFMATLADRKAVIVLPKYQSSGGGGSNPNQRVLDAANRRGQLVRLSSNKEFFSFNGLFIDMNVQNLDQGGALGAPRYFHVIGKDGRWHPGWESINFVADVKENDFISRYGIATGDKIAFDTFVAPSRWTGLFGPYYFLTKLVIQRLEEEARALRAFVKEHKPKAEKTPWQKDDSGDTSFKTRKVRVPVMEVEVDAPMVGDVPTADSCRGLIWQDSERLLKQVENDYLPALRFAVRATEYAWYKENGKAGGPENAGYPSTVPSRFEDETIKKTTWRRLRCDHIASAFGAKSELALRYRIRAKEVEVATK